MTLFVKQDVFRLKVSVENTLLVHVSQGKKDLCPVEFSFSLAEDPSFLLQLTKQISPRDKVKYPVEPLRRLKRVVKLQYELMIQLEHRSLFSFDVLIHVIFQDTFLIVDFQCVVFLDLPAFGVGVPMLDEVNFAISPLSHKLHDIPVFEVKLHHIN